MRSASFSRSVPVSRGVLAAVVAGVSSLGAQCPGGPTYGVVVSTAAPAQSALTRRTQAADLDGDGDLDLLLLQSGVRLLANDGLGHFAPFVQPSLTGALSMASGDLDGDGLPEVALTRWVQIPASPQTQYECELQVWGNHPQPSGVSTFTTLLTRTIVPAAIGLVQSRVAIADLDVDGIPDVVVLAAHNAVVLRGGGTHGVPDGTLGPAIPYPVPSPYVNEMRLLDIDGDGVRDLVAVVNSGAYALPGGVDANGRPDGSFGAAVSASIPGLLSYGIELADFDGDGIVDLAWTEQNTLHLHRGLPGFAFAPDAPVTLPYPGVPFAGDFDGDGALELCAPCEVSTYTGANVYFVDDPLGVQVVTMLNVGAGYPYSGAAGDFDRDGLLDVAIGKGSGVVSCALATCGAVPAVNVSTPNGGENWTVGVAEVVSWSASGPATAFDVEVTHDGGNTWRSLAKGVAGTNVTVWPTEPSTNLAHVRVTPVGHPTLADLSDGPFAIGGPGLAAAAPLGAGCGAPAPVLMTATVPQLGGSAVFSVFGAVVGAPVVTWLSLPAAVPLPLAPGCSLFVDFASLSPLAVVSAIAGRTTFVAGVPAVPGLAGLELVAQPLVFSATPAAGQIGNAVRLTLGF